MHQTTSALPVVSREWRHQDHPIFTPLVAFYCGVAYVMVVPAVFAAVLNAFLSRHAVQDVFPALLLGLIVPVVLMAREHTRRFGTYFLVGMIGTAIAVLGVGGVMFWLIMKLN